MIKIFLSVLLAILTLHGAAGSQTSNPRTVLDYYQLLPDKYFEANKAARVKWMLDSKRGAIVDVKNGYIYAPGDGAQSTIYVCLFRKVDGSHLVAIKSSHWEDTEYTDIDFFVYKQGAFIDVTKAVMPVAQNEQLRYEMPR